MILEVITVIIEVPYSLRCVSKESVLSFTEAWCSWNEDLSAQLTAYDLVPAEVRRVQCKVWIEDFRNLNMTEGLVAHGTQGAKYSVPVDVIGFIWLVPHRFEVAQELSFQFLCLGSETWECVSLNPRVVTRILKPARYSKRIGLEDSAGYSTDSGQWVLQRPTVQCGIHAGWVTTLLEIVTTLAPGFTGDVLTLNEGGPVLPASKTECTWESFGNALQQLASTYIEQVSVPRIQRSSGQLWPPAESIREVK